MPGMSQVVRAGNTLYISGQVGLDESGGVAENDADAQAVQIFENLKACLDASGASFDDIVKLTCFCVSVDDYAAYSKVKKQHVDSDGPAGTAVIVKALLDPRLLIEVEAVAVLERS